MPDPTAPASIRLSLLPDPRTIEAAEDREALRRYRAERIAAFVVDLTGARGEQIRSVEEVARRAADSLDRLPNVPVSSRAVGRPGA